MDAIFVSAFAAMGGSVVGAMSPVVSNYLLQQIQTRREILTRQVTQREQIYNEFITSASRLYVKSLTEDLKVLDELVALYALLSRMRLISSEPVLTVAKEIVARITQQYTEPNLTIQQIEMAALARKADPMSALSAACRKELLSIMNWNARFEK